MTLVMAAGAVCAADPQSMETTEVLTIDDFSRPELETSLGTKWESFTDQVMGGVSTGGAKAEEVDGHRALRLRGRVSLENNGGFVMTRAALRPDSGAFDASAYRGVRLTVRGNGEKYAVHLRTSSMWFPWQYYSADFPTGNEWRDVELPFAVFRDQNGKGRLDPATIISVGVVAIKKEMDADVSVSRVAFYKAP